MIQDGNNTPLSHKEQLRQLFLSQKHTLDLFLERGAISQAQYDKSLGDLREKMGFTDTEEINSLRYEKTSAGKPAGERYNG